MRRLCNLKSWISSINSIK